MGAKEKKKIDEKLSRSSSSIMSFSPNTPAEKREREKKKKKGEKVEKRQLCLLTFSVTKLSENDLVSMKFYNVDDVHDEFYSRNARVS